MARSPLRKENRPPASRLIARARRPQGQRRADCVLVSGAVLGERVTARVEQVIKGVV